ncbi:hypothetical protein ACIP9G_01555 [Lysinibacillus sp. NPDC093197]|uniref:hypothetical protein n=1 Tax=Lysinibacillus sp. NPDC093197 TaxID=3364132 RepID=UPI0038126D20
MDPDGEFSIRTSVLITAIDLLVSTIPGLYGINKLIQAGKPKKMVFNLLKGKQNTLKLKLKKYFTQLGAKMNVAIAQSGVIVNGLMTVFSTSVGGIVVWVVKRYFFQSVL